MSSSKPLRPSSRGSAEAAFSTTSVSTAVPPAFQASPFADTCEPNSFSEVSVRSDCDQVNLHNASLASVDTSKNNTTYRIPPELEKKRIEGPLFDTHQPDFINFHEESLQIFPNVPGSSLLWHTTFDVCEVSQI
uniref:Uncharacterized protein n=1 Tax=Panagrolaimus sp. ES5 TaxID=591445 RepID=A0AC34FGD7_9BILA